MSLVDNIPEELLLLIEYYGHPTDCFKCKRETLTVRMCSCSPKTKYCEDCLLKCNSCDYYVGKDNIVMWDMQLIRTEGNKYAINVKNGKYSDFPNKYSIKMNIDTKFSDFPNNYYSLYCKCEYCEGLFCHYCSIQSVNVCPCCISEYKYHN